MKQTTIYIALALSPGNKAITTLPRGVHIVVERVSWKDSFHLVLIDKDVQNSTSYFNLDNEELFDQLRIDGILNHHSVWRPVTDAVVEELPGVTLEDH